MRLGHGGRFGRDCGGSVDIDRNGKRALPAGILVVILLSPGEHIGVLGTAEHHGRHGFPVFHDHFRAGDRHLPRTAFICEARHIGAVRDGGSFRLLRFLRGLRFGRGLRFLRGLRFSGIRRIFRFLRPGRSGFPGSGGQDAPLSFTFFSGQNVGIVLLFLPGDGAVRFLLFGFLRFCLCGLLPSLSGSAAGRSALRILLRSGRRPEFLSALRCSGGRRLPGGFLSRRLGGRIFRGGRRFRGRLRFRGGFRHVGRLRLRWDLRFGGDLRSSGSVPGVLILRCQDRPSGKGRDEKQRREQQYERSRFLQQVQHNDLPLRMKSMERPIRRKAGRTGRRAFRPTGLFRVSSSQGRSR